MFVNRGPMRLQQARPNKDEKKKTAKVPKKKKKKKGIHAFADAGEESLFSF